MYDIKVKEKDSFALTTSLKKFVSLEPEGKTQELSQRVNNKKLKRKGKKYKDLVKGLRQ